MSPGSERTAALRDPALPAMATLLGDEAGQMLAAPGMLEGGRLPQIAQISWRPGTSLTVSYNTGTAWPLVAMTGGRVAQAPTLVERGEERVALWWLPDDPFLPGLAPALDPERALAICRDLGADVREVAPRVRAYRPGRRAVVEWQTGGLSLFVKVVRPSRVRRLQEQHQRASECLRVPRSHGWSREHGLVVLEALPGQTLREALEESGAALPAAEAIADLVARVPGPPDGGRAPSPIDTARGHGELLRRLAPEASEDIAAVVAVAEARRSRALVPVHGDLHEAQIMTSEGALTGVLDIDTIGLGYAEDDFGNLIGHLAVWGPISRAPGLVREYAKSLLAYADERLDPAALRRTAAATVLGLATGPFRVQSPEWPRETVERIRLAHEWAASAEAATSKKALIGVSGRAHAGAGS